MASVTVDKLDNLWRYPRGIKIYLKDKPYVFVTKDVNIGYVLYDGYKIGYPDDVLDEEEDIEILIEEFTEDSVSNLIKAYKAYITTLATEEVYLHKDTLDEFISIIKILEEIK